MIGQQSIDALEQIYGYMTFNNNKYGIITNWKRALFLRRAEVPGRKTLNFYCVNLDRRGHPISMLKAWVGMVLLADDDWFYGSPTISIVPETRNFQFTPAGWKKRKRAIDQVGEYRPKVINGTYRCDLLDFRLCYFDLSTARHSNDGGCVVDARFQKPSVWTSSSLNVKCKVVDILRYPRLGRSLKREAKAYAALKQLQGKAIPKFYGYYSVWGILKLLALAPVGEAITEDQTINEKLRRKMKATLGHIHDAGYIHGDIARRNFCRKRSGVVFLVDLDKSQRTRDQAEFDKEMRQVDEL